MRQLLPFLAAIVICAFSLPAAAQTGVAKGVDPDAIAQNKQAVRQLVVGADVAVGETVTTGSTGMVQLLFNDATKLVVGPSSSLLIEDYLVRPDNSAGKFAISALSGTFRFVTGKGPKNAYEITTPTGTIGVRGTAFDFTISTLVPDGVPRADLTTHLLLLEGVVRLCNLRGECVELDDRCHFGSFNSAGVVDLPSTRQTRTELRGLFPFSRSQRDLMFPFWVTGSFECLNPAPDTTGVVVVESDPSEPNVEEPVVVETTTQTTTDTTTTTTTDPSLT